MSQFRGFIAVDIDFFSKVLELEKEIKETGANVKLVEPENTHITLKFLGDTNESQISEIGKTMKDVVKGIDPFNIQLKGAGVYPNQNYIKIIWIGIKQGQPLEVIVKKIDEQFSKIGFKKEKRDFSPHLTIARVKSGKRRHEILHVIEKYKDIQFVDIRVDSIKLKKSDLTPKGPIYTNIIDVKL